MIKNGVTRTNPRFVFSKPGVDLDLLRAMQWQMVMASNEVDEACLLKGDHTPDTPEYAAYLDQRLEEWLEIELEIASMLEDAVTPDGALRVYECASWIGDSTPTVRLQLLGRSAREPKPPGCAWE